MFGYLSIEMNRYLDGALYEALSSAELKKRNCFNYIITGFYPVKDIGSLKPQLFLKIRTPQCCIPIGYPCSKPLKTHLHLFGLECA